MTCVANESVAAAEVCLQHETNPQKVLTLRTEGSPLDYAISNRSVVMTSLYLKYLLLKPENEDSPMLNEQNMVLTNFCRCEESFFNEVSKTLGVEEQKVINLLRAKLSSQKQITLQYDKQEEKLKEELLMALRNRNYKEAEELLKRGIDPNADIKGKPSALHIVTLIGEDIEAIKLLLQYGGNPLSVHDNPSMGFKVPGGYTPFSIIEYNIIQNIANKEKIGQLFLEKIKKELHLADVEQSFEFKPS
jgi:ankyrin repeat protein